MTLCEERGIAFLPWSPLGGIPRADEAAGRHGAVREAAEAHGVSPQQVALAWLLALSPVVIPIPGASRPESIQDSVRAVELREHSRTSWRRSREGSHHHAVPRRPADRPRSGATVRSGR